MQYSFKNFHTSRYFQTNVWASYSIQDELKFDLVVSQDLRSPQTCVGYLLVCNPREQIRSYSWCIIIYRYFFFVIKLASKYTLMSCGCYLLTWVHCNTLLVYFFLEQKWVLHPHVGEGSEINPQINSHCVVFVSPGFKWIDWQKVENVPGDHS